MTEQQTQTLPFRFSGNGGEYFKIWIVNLILNILTLGIYSAWAKVRKNRYFYGNTSLDNAAFEYHATPMMILKERLIAVAALLICVLLLKFFPTVGLLFTAILALLIPWVIWRSLQFNARMVSYRNVRFGFYGTLKALYTIFVLIPLLTIIIGAILLLDIEISKPGDLDIFDLVIIFDLVMTGVMFSAFIVTLMYPYIKVLLAGYYINNRQYGQGQFSAQLSAIKYYRIYLNLTGWTFLFYIFLPLLFFIPFSLWGRAFLEANVKHHLLNRTKLDDVLELHSNIKVGKLLDIYTINILLVGVTFGLAYPWAIIRLKKYKIESTSATIKGDIAQYVNQQQKAQSALSEEINGWSL